MKVYTCNSFQGYYVGTAAVVVAEYPEEAADLLNEELEKLKIPQRRPVIGEEMIEVDPTKFHVRILQDGNY